MSNARQAVQSIPTECARGSGWRQALHWLSHLCNSWSGRPPRQLRLCETLALGERRFLSLVELGEQRFLVGGTGSSLSLLAVLGHSSQPESKPYRQENAGAWQFLDGERQRDPGPG